MHYAENLKPMNSKNSLPKKYTTATNRKSFLGKDETEEPKYCEKNVQQVFPHL